MNSFKKVLSKIRKCFQSKSVQKQYKIDQQKLQHQQDEKERMRIQLQKQEEKEQKEREEKEQKEREEREQKEREEKEQKEKEQKEREEREKYIRNLELKLEQSESKPKKPQLSKALVDEFVDEMLKDENVNISGLPDFIERRVYANVIIMMMSMIDKVLESTHIQFMNHRIVFDVVPQEDE